MTSLSVSGITVEAPAKLNLGLEVIARRADGFHDLTTIFTTISIFDRISFTTDSTTRLRCNDPHLASDDNLILRALRAIAKETGQDLAASISLQKGIPPASGLGGASSDAAATLLAARELWQLALADLDLEMIARQLGSDVPFFLRGSCALGQDRGDLLEPLPVPPETWFVVVAPVIAIPRKTATLYAHLQSGDFSSGLRVAEQAARLRNGGGIDPALLGNAFSRPLYALVPELRTLPDTMRASGASSVALSGAGPSHYTVFDDPLRAEQIASELRTRLGSSAHVFVAAPIPSRSRDC